MIAALFATVGLLVTMGYFMLGSLPLLVLKHDTPLDARFIRAMFHHYYRAVLVTSVGACLAYAFAGRTGFAAGMGSVAALAWLSRRLMLPSMDALRQRIEDGDAAAIPVFRRRHVQGMLANALQLAVVAVSLTAL